MLASPRQVAAAAQFPGRCEHRPLQPLLFPACRKPPSAREVPRRGGGREPCHSPKYFGQPHSSLPHRLRAEPPRRGGQGVSAPFRQSAFIISYLLFIICCKRLAFAASTPPYCCRACRCIRRAGSRQGPRRRGPRQGPGLRSQTRPRRTRRPWAGRGPHS